MTSDITLTLPAESRFVSMARVAATSLAAELDFPIDRIEELRVGVNELAALLIERAEDDDAPTVRLTFRVGDDHLVVEGDIDGGRGSVDLGELDELTGMILAGVVDEHEVAARSGRLLKRRGDG